MPSRNTGLSIRYLLSYQEPQNILSLPHPSVHDLKINAAQPKRALSLVEKRTSEFVVSAKLPLGATCTRDGVAFLVWAPNAAEVTLLIEGEQDRLLSMQRDQDGYHFVHVPELRTGARYSYSLDGKTFRPDPASRSQPLGVHGPSEVIDLAAEPKRGRQGPDLRDYILYEAHVGALSPEGTFDGVIRSLDRIQKLGITALELMPVAEFPGNRNWGYDGVCPFAAHSGYGGPRALRRLVTACHDRGMAFVLDVVYNHLGPEGNYLREFGPYFTDRYRTPWGEAINFDGPHSDHVRRYFIENAMYWVRDCGVDALRLDAVHAIFDRSAHLFLEELSEAIQQFARESGRRIYLIAESDLNDARVIRPRSMGWGLDAQWSDDFHHSLHTLLTGERSGYYADFGDLEQLAGALRQGWTYTGQYSKVRSRRFGNSPSGLSPHKFVVCAQNHDQVGNRMCGDRLCNLAGWEPTKLAAATVLLSPFTPLLFMGEEYAEPAPFLYFVSHSDPDLQDAVSAGRKAEFCDFINQGEAPDPQDECTFERSKLRQHLAAHGRHATMHAFYSELIALRKAHQAFRPMIPDSTSVQCRPAEQVIEFCRTERQCSIRVLLNFGRQPRSFSADERWKVVLNSADRRWAAELSEKPERIPLRPPMIEPFSCIVLTACGHKVSEDGRS